MKSEFKKAYAKKKKTGTIWENLKSLAPVKEKKLKLKLPSKDTGKKRGRPVGSKNKSTGRKAPVGGFKSSEFIDPKDDEDATPHVVKRGRGRPKGAKNKPKKDDMSDISAGFEAGLAKRGRGRPKGSKNKERVRGDTTNQNAPSFKSFMANKKGEASDADVAKYSTPKVSIKDRLGKRKVGRPKGGGVFKGGDEFGNFEKKARKVRSDKGVKRGKRVKVI